MSHEHQHEADSSKKTQFRAKWVFIGFLMMFGFLLQWPTLITLVMFPILVFMYRHLALAEEKDVRAQFGEEYVRYASTTPAFISRWSSFAIEKKAT